MKITKPATIYALSKGDVENAIRAETPGGIEAQEAAGQRQLVGGGWMPREMIRLHYSGDSRMDLERMGFQVTGITDSLFYFVEMPPGWQVISTEHSRLSNLLDDQGRRRARIIYDAAFYDRRAYMYLNGRYSFSVVPVKGWDGYDFKVDAVVCQARDGETVIWCSDEIIPSQDRPQHEIRELLELQGKQWLDEHYPDWQDEFTYWD